MKNIAAQHGADGGKRLNPAVLIVGAAMVVGIVVIVVKVSSGSKSGAGAAPSKTTAPAAAAATPATAAAAATPAKAEPAIYELSRGSVTKYELTIPAK